MSGIADLIKRVQEMGKLKSEIGWQDTAKYPDGTPVALVAQTQEYLVTSGGVRSFVRPTIASEKGNWSRQMGIGVKAVANGTRVPLQVFTTIGELAAGDVRMTITQISSPPLADSTKRARAARGLEPEKPLQATGLMLSTCTSIVKEK